MRVPSGDTAAPFPPGARAPRRRRLPSRLRLRPFSTTPCGPRDRSGGPRIAADRSVARRGGEAREQRGQAGASHHEVGGGPHVRRRLSHRHAQPGPAQHVEVVLGVAAGDRALAPQAFTVAEPLQSAALAHARSGEFDVRRLRTRDEEAIAPLLLQPRQQEEWRDRLFVARSQASYIELAAPGVSKSGALQWLCDREGLRRERTVACGDAQNDLDMLRWAGLGVAMAEAAPEVRAAADLVVARAGLPALLAGLAAAPRD